MTRVCSLHNLQLPCTPCDDARALLKLDGAQKFDSGKPPVDLLSPHALIELSKVLAFGAKKYAPNNWRKGMPWSKVLGSCGRHWLAYMMGQTKDPETGLSHMAHLMCEAMFLLEYEVTHPDKDDRFKLPDTSKT